MQAPPAERAAGAARTAAVVGARGPHGRSQDVQVSVAWPRLVGLAPLALALVGLVLLVLGPPVAGAVLVVAGVAVTVLSWWAGSPARLAARLGGRRADPVGDARLANVAEGLCVALGLPVPELRVLDDPAPNALLLGGAPASTVLVCTTGLLALLDRMELEGLVAHELAHLKRGDVARAAAATQALGAAALVSSGAGRGVRRLAGLERESLADLRAVGATRYPPGLASALEKLAGAPSTRPGGLDRLTARLTAALWCAPLEEARAVPAAVGVLEVGERAAALREL